MIIKILCTISNTLHILFGIPHAIVIFYVIESTTSRHISLICILCYRQSPSSRHVSLIYIYIVYNFLSCLTDVLDDYFFKLNLTFLILLQNVIMLYVFLIKNPYISISEFHNYLIYLYTSKFIFVLNFI